MKPVTLESLARDLREHKLYCETCAVTSSYHYPSKDGAKCPTASKLWAQFWRCTH